MDIDIYRLYQLAPSSLTTFTDASMCACTTTDSNISLHLPRSHSQMHQCVYTRTQTVPARSAFSTDHIYCCSGVSIHYNRQYQFAPPSLTHIY